MWENIAEPDKPNDNIIWRMRFACWITKATNTRSEYVIRIAFPPPQWLCERASMLRYMYIACLLDIVCDVFYRGFHLFVWPNTATLSHGNPASSGPSHDSYRTQGSEKRKTVYVTVLYTRKYLALCSVIFRTHVHAYVPWIQKFSRMGVGCGISHKQIRIQEMQRIQNCYGTNYYKDFVNSIMRHPWT
jgi:hypothetical protein